MKKPAYLLAITAALTLVVLVVCTTQNHKVVPEDQLNPLVCADENVDIYLSKNITVAVNKEPLEVVLNDGKFIGKSVVYATDHDGNVYLGNEVDESSCNIDGKTYAFNVALDKIKSIRVVTADEHVHLITL